MASLTRRPNGRWRARYRDPDGRERARHFERRADAERWLSTVKADIARGTYLDPAAARTTFQQFADGGRAQQPHRPGTVRLYERTLRLHVYPVIGTRQLGTLRRSDIRGWSPAWSSSATATSTWASDRSAGSKRTCHPAAGPPTRRATVS